MIQRDAKNHCVITRELVIIKKNLLSILGIHVQTTYC